MALAKGSVLNVGYRGKILGILTDELANIYIYISYVIASYRIFKVESCLLNYLYIAILFA